MEPRREKWSSLLSFIWVAAGAAVGLGNIWKFPYMAGSYGGSAFVLMYLFFVLIVAVPVMIAEIMLGKLGQRDAVANFVYLAKNNGLSPKWRYTGYLGSLTLFLVFCFYSVVAGFSIAYLGFAGTNKFVNKSPEQIQTIWVDFLSEPALLIGCAFLFIFFTMAIVYFGIKRGIERACSWMMPALLLVLVILVIYASMGSGFKEALSFLFAFEPEKIEAKVVISSLGHAFFTLAVGACAMMVYGSHLPQKVSVIRAVLVVAVLDVLVAMLSGLAIFPLIFASGFSPSQGPGLMFVSLPMVFATMPAGWFLGSLFFLLLFFAALSSSLSFAEPLVDLLINKLKIRRSIGVYLVGLATLLGSILCALSFNIWSETKLFGRWNIFDFVADLSTNLLLPLGGIAIALFAGLVIKPSHLFGVESLRSRVFFPLWRMVILVVAPLAILIVMISGLSEFLA
jgi:NSS family neurotransmitter:Na+ symporter